MRVEARLARVGLAFIAVVTSALTLAQEYPIKPVRILVPYPAGGQPDLISRTLGQSLSSQLGQPFVTENIPGSGAIAAVNNFMASPPDGYTLFQGDAGMWAVGPALRKSVPYDFWKEFTPIRQTHTTTLLLATGPSMPPVKDFNELLALVRAKPGHYSYGSAGIGSIQHLTMEALKHAYKLELLHVPYKSGASAMPALIGGQINMMITAFSTVASFSKGPNSRINMVAVTTRSRSPVEPNLPSVSEYGVADFDYGSGGALLARAGTPPAVINRLAAALDKAFASSEVINRMKALNIEYREKATSESTAAYIRADIKRISDTVRIANIPKTE